MRQVWIVCRSLRIEEAKQLLETDELKVEEVGPWSRLPGPAFLPTAIRAQGRPDSGGLSREVCEDHREGSGISADGSHETTHLELCLTVGEIAGNRQRRAVPYLIRYGARGL